MCIDDRVQESNRRFTNIDPSLIDQCDYSTDNGRRSRCTEDEGERSVDGNDVVGAVGTDVWETTSLAGVVEAVGTVWWGVVGEE